MTGKNKRKLSGGFSQKSRSKVIRSNSMNAVGGHLCLSQDDNKTTSQVYTCAAGLGCPIDLDSVGSQGSTSQCTSHAASKGYTIKCKHCAEEINMNAEDSEISHLQCCICDSFYHGECLSVPQTLLLQLYIVIEVGGWSCSPCRRSMRSRKPADPSVPLNGSASSSDSSNISSVITNIKNQLKSITEFLASNFSVHNTALTTPVSMVIGQQSASVNGSTSAVNSDVVGSHSYAGVAAGKNRVPRETPSTMDAVLKAVHTDLMDKQQRMKNVIVQGLKPSTTPSVSDSDLFQKFCFDHLGVSLNVNHCRRVGQRTNGKVQTLLVVLPSTDAVQSLLSIAKRLRKSGDDYVRSNVYIGPDLTRAEAAAEFEVRENRRRRRLENKALFRRTKILQRILQKIKLIPMFKLEAFLTIPFRSHQTPQLTHRHQMGVAIEMSQPGTRETRMKTINQSINQSINQYRLLSRSQKNQLHFQFKHNYIIVL